MGQHHGLGTEGQYQQHPPENGLEITLHKQASVPCLPLGLTKPTENRPLNLPPPPQPTEPKRLTPSPLPAYCAMPLSWNEIKHRAIAFSKEWKEETNEHAEAKSFWDAFFQVFGISHRVELFRSTCQNATILLPITPLPA